MVTIAGIRSIHEAQEKGAQSLTLWGSGKPRREFIFSNDIADACIALLAGDTRSIELPLNLGTGRDFSISELAVAIAKVVGYKGKFEWDMIKPDGAPQKLLDSSRLRGFGWTPKISIEDGLFCTYQWYLKTLVHQINSE